jgi:hypothetical protein
MNYLDVMIQWELKHSQQQAKQQQRRRSSLNSYLPGKNFLILPSEGEERQDVKIVKSNSAGYLPQYSQGFNPIQSREGNRPSTYHSGDFYNRNPSMFGVAKQAADATVARVQKELGGERQLVTKNKRLKLLRSSSTISAAESVADISDEDMASSNSLTSEMTGDVGLQIYPKDGCTRLSYCYDAHHPSVHPNAFTPKCLTNVVRLSGGGSGIAVFSGTHPELGDLVMKHGGSKDLQEIFALLTIADQLNVRGREGDRSEAALAVEQRLPRFEMIYISPHHITLKTKELFSRLRKIVSVGNLLRINRRDSHKQRKKVKVSLDDEDFLTPGMSIRIYEHKAKEIAVVLDDKSRSRKPSLAFVLPKACMHFIGSSTLELGCWSEYESMHMIYEQLQPIMMQNLFKFTLAQKRIGGPNAKTGNQWLYEGKLKGKVLDNLVSQFCETVRNLQKLTLPDEVDVVEQIREEIEMLEANDANMKADAVSIMIDQFTGSAIRKNFHPTKGRLRFFRRLCRSFREKNLDLTPQEEVPAMHLGNLMVLGALMSDTFVGASTEPTLLQPYDLFWKNLLARSVESRPGMSENALKRVWTSGLTDAGIHNLFVSEEDLYFFDLGEPQLQSIPGFMTKFLFSFFHTLGMQENENKEWVHRFVPTGNKLALTEGTRELLDSAYDAFEIALDQIIEDLFDGDHHLRWLLLQYVTLQLLSDAAFCLSRWEVKGGGHKSDDNHNEGLERWLWRAIWDCYVAFDINTTESWARFDAESSYFMGSILDSMDSNRSSLSLQEFGSADAERFKRLSSGSDRRSSFGKSLRDLTLSTYHQPDTDSSSSNDHDHVEEVPESDEDEDDDVSDDDSAIGPEDSSSSRYITS